MLCFSAMQAQVKYLVKSSDANTALAIPLFINQEIRTFNSQHWMDDITQISAHTTIANTGLYTLSPYAVDVIGVWDASVKYTKASYQDIISQDPNLNGGYGNFYAERELGTGASCKQIFLYPVPTAANAFSVQYTYKLPELVNAGDYLAFVPPQFENIQDMIIMGAARMVALSQNDTTRYGIFEKEYERLKFELRKANERRQDDNPQWTWDNFKSDTSTPTKEDF
jgi:hypothetical protein